MFNLSGGEIVVILVLALIVIGPERLPEAVRKAGRAYAELRKLSAGFQSELQDNLGEPLRAVQDTVNMMRSDFQSVVNTVAGSLDPTTTSSPAPSTNSEGGDVPDAPAAVDAAPNGRTEPTPPADVAANGRTEPRPPADHRPAAPAFTDVTPPADVTTPEADEPS